METKNTAIEKTKAKIKADKEKITSLQKRISKNSSLVQKLEDAELLAWAKAEKSKTPPLLNPADFGA